MDIVRTIGVKVRIGSNMCGEPIYITKYTYDIIKCKNCNHVHKSGTVIDKNTNGKWTIGSWCPNCNIFIDVSHFKLLDHGI